MRAFEYNKFLGVAEEVFQNSLGIELSNIHGAIWIFPIIHSGVLRLSEDRVRINIEYINL